MKTLADLTLGARRRSNTERSNFVSDEEVGGYVNDGIKVLYDRIIAADDSYYQTLVDFSFAGVTETAASYPLPADFGRMRGLTQFPDTPRARPVFSISYADRQRKPGYYLNGNSITVSPYRAAPRGPWRLAYVPKAPQLAGPVTISNLTPDIAGAITVTSGTDQAVAPSAYAFTGYPAGVGLIGQWLVTAGWTNAANNGQKLITDYNLLASSITVDDAGLIDETATPAVAASVRKFNQLVGTWNAAGFAVFAPVAGDILTVSGSQYCDGTFVVLTASGTTLTTDATGLTTAETFGDGVTVTIQRASQLALDVTMDNYDEIPELWAAVRIVEKQKRDTSNLQGLLSGGFARVDAMAAGRQSEPEAAPVLWRPSFDPVNGFGWGGEGGGW